MTIKDQDRTADRIQLLTDESDLDINADPVPVSLIIAETMAAIRMRAVDRLEGG